MEEEEEEESQLFSSRSLYWKHAPHQPNHSPPMSLLEQPGCLSLLNTEGARKGLELRSSLGGMSHRRVDLPSTSMAEITCDTHSSEDGSVLKKTSVPCVFGALVDCGERGWVAADGTHHSVTNNASEPLQQ